jgi:hypothetical protein
MVIETNKLDVDRHPPPGLIIMGKFSQGFRLVNSPD